MARRKWNLVRGGEVLAVLTPDGKSLVPELDGHLTFEAAYETTPALEPVRPLFEREAELLEVDQEPENSAWIEVWEELQAPGLFVESLGGRERLAVHWIHFKHGRAWWLPLYNSPETRLRK